MDESTFFWLRFQKLFLLWLSGEKKITTKIISCILLLETAHFMSINYISNQSPDLQLSRLRQFYTVPQMRNVAKLSNQS